MMIINLFGIILFLRMKFMDKIVQLPKITLRELQEKLRVQSNSPKRLSRGGKDVVSSSWQPKDIKISSPFYLKQQHHKEKCECQYHRMKRAYQESIQRLRKKEQYQPFQLTKTQPTQLHNSSHNEKTPRHKEPTQRLSAYRLLVPLGSNGTVKDEKGQEREAKPTWRDRQIMGERSVKLQKISKRQFKDQDEQNNNNTFENDKPTNLKTNRTFKSKHKIAGSNISLQAGNPSCRIDANNSEFISLISQRLENNKYKDKYLKTLFSFIKMKTNANRQYMWDSKAYLENNLNILLNHYSMKKLVQVEELQQEETDKIAYYMNCLPQKVPTILGELGMAVNQMEQFLSQLKKKRIQTGVGLQTQHQNSQRFENLFETEGSIKGDPKDASNNRCTRTTNSLLCEQDANQNSSKNNILTNRFNTSGDQQDKENSIHNSKAMNFRKSMRQMGEFESHSLLKRTSQQKKEEGEEKKRVSVRHSQTIPDSMNRSTRSTVLGIVDEVEKQHRFSKRLKKAKPKRIQFIKKYSDIQIDQKYSSINYEKFCHKKTFISLIGQIERLDQNDTERAQHFYRQLNIEQFLDNGQKIDQLVKTFQILMSEKTKEQLMKHIVAVKDKRYIQKLERQLDDMLGEIKKNDPRRHNEDFFQIRENTRPSHNQKTIVEFKHHIPDRNSAINKIIYYEANQQIQKRKEQQKEIKLDLAQTDLREIIFEQVKPGLVQSIYHSSSKKDIEYQRPTALPNLPNQKKILQYMKRNFSTTFNYLANEIHSICRSLQKDA